jgi:Na+-transporting methylmalonyl-CoA/oxaloacetate decarboxylase gamma subunit
VHSDESAGVVVVLIVLSLLMLAMAVRIVKQYENGVPGVCCADPAGQKAPIRNARGAECK